MLEELLTLTEVADLLRIPVATLRYWRANGTGPHGFHVGRKVIFTRTEVLRWLTEQEGVSA
jgi:excisionase family DNA binding protein